MSINWKDVHFGVLPVTNTICIGKLKPMKDDPSISIWTDRSEDISHECINAVCCKLRNEQEMREDEKPYAGYYFEDGSQLIWVAPNYEIEIK